jgi:hypothetical protein
LYPRDPDLMVGTACKVYDNGKGKTVFYLPQLNLFVMSYTNEQMLLLAEKAQNLLDAQDLSELKNNLNIMLQSYFMYHDAPEARSKDSIYASFLNIVYFLEESEQVLNSKKQVA